MCPRLSCPRRRHLWSHSRARVVIWAQVAIALGLARSPDQPKAYACDPEPVGVFVDHDWALLSRNDVLPAPLCARILEPHVAVRLFTAGDLSDPERLDASRLRVLVLPDTDTLPAAARPALVKFRRAGGSLVMCGRPPVTLAARAEQAGPNTPRWTVRPADGLLRHDADGLGLFATLGGLPRDKTCTRSVAPNPLGITVDMLAGESPHQQRLDPASLPPGDELIPLVVVQQGAEPPTPIAAAIRHRCREANGARDVWLGQVVRNLDASERWFAEQLLVRGVLWILQEQGLLSAAHVAASHRRLDAIPKPSPLPDRLPITRTPRSWGESLVPKSPPPARRLAVVDLSRLPLEERAALCCLQGLTARRQPAIWLLRSGRAEDQDRFWLDQHVACNAIDGYDMVADWTEILRAHATEVKGAVIADPACDRGAVIAMNVAACEDLILCTPDLAERLGLPVKIDLRGRFASYLAGMRWVWATYRDRLSRHALDYFHPARLAWGNVDHCYQWRIPLVWTAYKADAFAPGADPANEHDLVARMLASMDTHSIVTGWPSFGPNLGVDEYIAVMQATPYTHGYVPSDGLANLSVMSGVRLDLPGQPTQRPAPPVEAGKIYVSVVISDGDNLSPWMQYFREHYFAADAAPLPLGITIGPAIREAMPAMARWYQEHARSDMEFVCGVSGATYVSPEVFASRVADPEAAWGVFFEDTRKGMEALGLRTVNISPRGEPLAERYARGLPFCHSVITAWHRRDDDPGRLVTALPAGIPAFWSSTPGRLDFEPAVDGGVAMAKAFYTDLDKLVSARLAAGAPAFACSVLSCWDWKKEPLRQLAVQKPAHVVFVTPAQLAAVVAAAGRTPSP